MFRVRVCTVAKGIMRRVRRTSRVQDVYSVLRAVIYINVGEHKVRGSSVCLRPYAYDEPPGARAGTGSSIAGWWIKLEGSEAISEVWTFKLLYIHLEP